MGTPVHRRDDTFAAWSAPEGEEDATSRRLDVMLVYDIETVR
jgi:hypothetical protein